MPYPRAARLTLALGTSLACACSVFEPPIYQGPSDAAMDASDATITDAGSDAQMDAMVDAEVIPIPQRPALASCGFGASQTLGTVTNAALDEVSGVAASRAHPGVFWMIEDSGGASVVYAVNAAGVTVAAYNLPGSAVDYEDIAIGPGPMAGVDYIYVADIGDNSSRRQSRTVYRAPEPVVTPNQTYTTGTLTSVEPLPFTFPGIYIEDNAEALFVDPANQDMYVVTKNGFSRPNTVFRLAAPHQPAVTRVMTFVGSVYAGDGIDIAITSADISADGTRIALRSLHSVNYWTRSLAMTIADTILTTTPCDGDVGTGETKGESITFGADGYYTFSEGISQALSFIPFSPP